MHLGPTSYTDCIRGPVARGRNGSLFPDHRAEYDDDVDDYYVFPRHATPRRAAPWAVSPSFSPRPAASVSVGIKI